RRPAVHAHEPVPSQAGGTSRTRLEMVAGRTGRRDGTRRRAATRELLLPAGPRLEVHRSGLPQELRGLGHTATARRRARLAWEPGTGTGGEAPISGIVAAYGAFDPLEGLRMLDRLSHRGPDGQGWKEFEHAWLGHRRLAIVDLEGGAQPLRDPKGLYWLVGDGEVYNYRRLRRELEARGYVFRTRADQESALHLLEADGLQALSRLWGTFAFAGATTDGRFFAARDTIGIAPLYWSRHDETVIFGSELKAFDPDRRASVEPFPPGHVWTPDEG